MKKQIIDIVCIASKKFEYIGAIQLILNVFIQPHSIVLVGY